MAVEEESRFFLLFLLPSHRPGTLKSSDVVRCDFLQVCVEIRLCCSVSKAATTAKHSTDGWAPTEPGSDLCM